MVCLSLLLLALKYEITTTKPLKFIGVWTLSLSIAVWLSTPSVFVIASIGIYYFWGIVTTRNAKLLIPLGVVWAAYLVQFGLYYQLLLLPSIKSEYLQNWQEHYFLNFSNWDAETMKQNKQSLKQFFSTMAGENWLSRYFNLVFLLVGCINFIKSKSKEFFLIALPIIFLIVAAALHKYTLLPRVCSFVYPLILLIIAKGLESVFTTNMLKKFIIVPLFICLFILYSFNKVAWLWEPPKFEKTTESFDSVKSKNVDAVYIHSLVKPPTIYYTTIHPDSSQWKWIGDATVLNWDTNIDSLFAASPKRCAVLYNWMNENELSGKKNIFYKYYSVSDSLISNDQHIFLLSRKDSL